MRNKIISAQVTSLATLDVRGEISGLKHEAQAQLCLEPRTFNHPGASYRLKLQERGGIRANSAK